MEESYLAPDRRRWVVGEGTAGRVEEKGGGSGEVLSFSGVCIYESSCAQSIWPPHT